jgi:hypothetical protein
VLLAPYVRRLAAAGGGGGGGREGGGAFIIKWQSNGVVPGLALFLTALVTTPGTSRVLLSMAGGTMLVPRTYNVWRTKGNNSKLADCAIEESLMSVLLVLASFL